MSDVDNSKADETDETNGNNVENQKRTDTGKECLTETEKRQSEEKKKLKEKRKKREKKRERDIEKMKDILDTFQGNKSQFEDYVSSVKQMLDENPEKLSLQTDSKSCKEAVKRMEDELITCVDFLQAKEFTPTQVVEKSTAVQGTFCTKNLDDWIQSRRQMVNIGRNVEFRSPTQTQKQNVVEHNSQSSSASFNKAVEKSGWGLAVGLKAYKPKVGIDVGYEKKSEEEKTSKRHSSSKTSYLCKSTYVVVPVALWTASLSDVSLSKDVIGELKQVEHLILLDKNELVKQKVMEIFKTYGSHFYCGDIHFGGLFQITTEYQTVKESRKAEVQEIVSVAHHGHANACFNLFGIIKIGGGTSGHTGNIEGKIEEGLSSSQCSNIHMSLTKLGGPIAIDSVGLWKKGLVENNSSWVVVDGGKPIFTDDGELNHKDFEGLWNLVQNESSLFKDSIVLSNVLLEIWHAESGLQVPESMVQIFNINWHKSKIVNIIAQSAKQQLTSMSCIAVFNEISTIVCKSGTATILHPLWREELNNNSQLQFLFESLQSIQFKEIEAIEICDKVQTLLKIASDVHFPQKAALLGWLKEIENPNTKKLFDNDTIISIGSFFVALRAVPPYQNITGEVAIIIKQLFEKLRTGNDVLEYMVFVSFVSLLDFDVKEGRFRVKLDSEKTYTCINETEKVQAKLQKLSKMQRSEASLQALILKDIVNNIKTTTQNDLPETKNILTTMRSKETMNDIRKHFGASLDSMIITAINQEDVDEILKTLKPIADGQGTANESHLSWAYFERFPSDNFRSLDSKVLDNPDDGTGGTDNTCLEDILKTFGMVKYFPERISVQMALSIHDDAQNNGTAIIWIILKKIISANSDFREKVLKDFWNISHKAKSDHDDLLADLSSSDEDDTLQREAFHPSDVFLAIFQCCDPFLKRLIATKLSSCQFAVPILFTNYVKEDLVFSTWPINDVVLHGETETVIKNTRHSVSFIRVGKGAVPSKSKLINEFLRELNEEHATFIHKDCPLGMNHRTISKGMVEMSWLVPDHHNSNNQFEADGTRRDTHIEAQINIFNLRGDAQMFENQLNMLLLLSNVIVIIISCDDLKQGKLSRIIQKTQYSNISVILLTDITGNSNKEFLRRYTKELNINLAKTRVLSTFEKQRNESDVAIKRSSSDLKEIITTTIVKLLRDIPEGIQIEKVKTYLPAGIRSDESQKCVIGRELANSLLKECMHSGRPENRKDTILPLQGKRLWHEISRKEKDLKRTKSEVFANGEKISKNIKELRKKQTRSCNEAPDAFSIFVATLLQYTADEEVLQYFIIWFKQILNNESRVLLKELLHNFFTVFENHESTKGTTEVENKTQQELDKADKTLADASFGIEHFFREIGQVYEAFMHTSEDFKCNLADTTGKVLKHLPIIVARLLLLGHSFEIMDGDAANVPQKWVAAVLRAVQNIVGLNKKVVTVSVLGIQSSGKSTLLNTMFGFEFSVSAGRCTRGIFIQLVPVNNFENVKADYLLVLDTEGLRAPERASENVHHDNEIATLVVGLADVVLLNLKGESISDMANILEIVITGLLRLQQVNKSLTLSQSCIFVHQNVSKDAKLMMLQGNRNIVKHLDTMTKDVANQENIADINHFADVIKFNPTKDIKYVPDLFHGSPGMAPVNQNYSLEVMGVHKCILREKAPRTRPLSFENYLLHLQSLWQGIQAEDFIFSFRSILEIKSYGILESEYQRLIWELEEWKLEWMQNNIKPRLQSCVDVVSINECMRVMITEFRDEIETRYINSEKSLEDFVKSSELQEHMEHYKVEKRINMERKKNNLTQDTLQSIQQEQAKCTSNLSSVDIVTEKEKLITETARYLARNVSDTKPSRDKMDKEFVQMWTQFLNDLASPNPLKTTIEKENIMIGQMEQVLNDLYARHGTLLRKGIQECPIDKGKLSDRLTDTHSNVKLEENFLKLFVKVFHDVIGKENFQSKAKNVVKELFIDIDHEFDSMLRKDTEYNQSQFSAVMKKIITKFKSLKGYNRGITFTPEQEISVALHVARHSFHQFAKMNRMYEEKHGLQARLEAKKPIVYQMFINTCEKQAEEIIATKTICAELKISIEDKLKRELPLKMITGTVNKFNQQKLYLIKSIMEELATTCDFDEFMYYIGNPETYVQTWLQRVTDTGFFQKTHDSACSPYFTWLNLIVNEVIDDIKTSASATLATFDKSDTKKQSRETFPNWIESFKSKGQKLGLLLDCKSVKCLSNHFKGDFCGFLKIFIKHLSELKTVLIDTWKEKQPSDFTWTESPYDKIYELLWGCSKKCPWCSEPCIKSDNMHESDIVGHHCIQHRPSGVQGMGKRGSGIICIESCSYLVQCNQRVHCGKWCKCPTPGCNESHTASYMENWDIQPSADMSNSIYWNWFMKTYIKKLANYYGRKEQKIPDSWTILTKDDAIKSLTNVFNIS